MGAVWVVQLALTSPKAIAAALVGLAAHRLQRVFYFQKTRYLEEGCGYSSTTTLDTATAATKPPPPPPLPPTTLPSPPPPSLPGVTTQRTWTRRPSCTRTSAMAYSWCASAHYVHACMHAVSKHVPVHEREGG